MKKLIFVLVLILSPILLSAEPDAPDAAPVEVDQPDEPVTLSTFYESLAPHGTWVQDPTYGWVWQPRVLLTDAEWRPYCHEGRWVWTNHGWYWESNYRWGWAAFHYGRWARHATLHWIWVPDCTWGPSWVNWRECDSHLGWAPLPPECRFEAGVGFSYRGRNVEFGFDFGLVDIDFTFVPCHTFLEVNLWRHRCGHREVRRIYHTTVIHNTYVVKRGVKNIIIINNGCSKTVIEKRTNRKIKEVTIHSSKNRGERHTKNGISTYRPEVKNAAPRDPRQVEQKRKERQQQRNNSIRQPEQRPERVAPPVREHREPKAKREPRLPAREPKAQRNESRPPRLHQPVPMPRAEKPERKQQRQKRQEDR